MHDVETLHKDILAGINLSEDIDDEELIYRIYSVIKEYARNCYISLGERALLGKELFNTFRKLDILEEFLLDDEITEIMINGTESIFYEKHGRLFPSDRRFYSKEKLNDLIQQIVSRANRLVNEASPIVDTRLEDGSRVNVVLHPVALNGPILTIRKFPKDKITMDRLLTLGSVNQEVADFLIMLVRARYNIFISGGTGSGKTTFLNALSQFIPREERVIVIEDNAELDIIDIPNMVHMEARNPNTEGVGEITIDMLIKTALRQRPSRIIIGEIRGKEAISLLQALNTGHSGSISTGHGNNTKDMLGRIATMVLMGMDMPLPAVERQIASGIDILVHLGRMPDKSRKLIEISEITGYENNEIQVTLLYQYRGGQWIKINEIKNKEKLLLEGYNEEGLSEHTFEVE
ncbi:CpaF family protein [Aequitasia blattaphilus]|uniref:Flp pilus assembly complex ATPase component TadA n=1 Tax=Aequitasia blattaphilus TaxID=2949332 RepID=A0ABT1E9C7_9FIRM|nr:ATPase, T2SS/T4P/T4SS family [Aequitasia blattaphilus]MCP1102440.1 Flp pilus assembly complex ATPase component TadA [Aequitasia blattaphilus]MCR8615080.1 Flp pilus assembly complex ATPase component TadA [Aequitasia blattaphilus]